MIKEVLNIQKMTITHFHQKCSYGLLPLEGSIQEAGTDTKCVCCKMLDKTGSTFGFWPLLAKAE